jgi:hypothetical protein
MSRRKKKIVGMSDNAQAVMYNVGKESYEKATRVTRGVDSVGTLAFAQHCSSYAKEGFKKGYDVGRREEMLKNFNVGDEIKRFEGELKKFCEEHGYYLGNEGFVVESGLVTFSRPRMTVKFSAVADIEKLRRLYINRTFGDWRKNCCAVCKWRKFGEHKSLNCAMQNFDQTDKDPGFKCDAVREYLQTGIVPERIKKSEDQ